MSDIITRRHLLGVAGAGLTLSGCGWRPFGFDGGDGNMHDTGWSEPHGLPATFDPDDLSNPATDFRGVFKPAYLMLVHVHLAPEWKMNFTFGSYEIGQGVNEKDRLATAVDILKTKVSGVAFETMDKGPGYMQHNGKFRKSAGEASVDRTDLKEFGFSKQAEIFFYFDNAFADLDKPLVVFTSKCSTGQGCDKNYAFFAAKRLDPAGIEANPGELLRIRNYLTDERAKKIGSFEDPDTYHYSMNIHLSVPDEGQPGSRFPIIFDPDTGNGMGYEP